MSAQNSALTALGFNLADDGTLVAPAGSSITLAPVQGFYRLTVTLPAGDRVSCVVASVALKISRSSTSRP
jgi:hypothetical protein